MNGLPHREYERSNDSDRDEEEGILGQSRDRELSWETIPPPLMILIKSSAQMHEISQREGRDQGR